MIPRRVAGLFRIHSDTRRGRLAHLKEMTSLQQISLKDTHISDAGLAQLNGMTGLRALWLGNPKVTDSGVADMRSALPKLMITN